MESSFTKSYKLGIYGLFGIAIGLIILIIIFPKENQSICEQSITTNTSSWIIITTNLTFKPIFSVIYKGKKIYIKDTGYNGDGTVDLITIDNQYIERFDGDINIDHELITEIETNIIK